MPPSKIAGQQKRINLYRHAFDIAAQACIISTVREGKIIDVNQAACKLLGYSKRELLTKTRSIIFNTDESSFKKKLAQRTVKGHASAFVTAIKKSGEQVACEIISVPVAGDHGIAKAITTIVDSSETVLNQNKMDSKNEQIAEAVMKAHELEKSDLGKELHDNVNQLLSLSHLFLDMGRKDGADKEMYLKRCSEYTLAAIREIRKLSRGLVTGEMIRYFGLSEAIDNISTDMMEAHPVKVSCMVDDLIENRVNEKFKQDVFRIVQEQLTNIIKHARASVIKMVLSQNKNAIILSISDDGAGFDIAKKQNGIGIANIKSRAAFYTGKAIFVSEPGKGCVLTITFPVTEALLNKS